MISKIESSERERNGKEKGGCRGNKWWSPNSGQVPTNYDYYYYYFWQVPTNYLIRKKKANLHEI